MGELIMLLLMLVEEGEAVEWEDCRVLMVEGDVENRGGRGQGRDRGRGEGVVVTISTYCPASSPICPSSNTATRTSTEDASVIQRPDRYLFVTDDTVALLIPRFLFISPHIRSRLALSIMPVSVAAFFNLVILSKLA